MLDTTKRRGGWYLRLLAAFLAVIMVAAACGDDDDDVAPGDEALDDDGEVTVGLIVAGDRNDGGFYQGQVDALEPAAEARGWDVIVVDQVDPGAAQEAFENLARQGPDLIIGGGAELAEGFVPVADSPEFAERTWVLVAPFPPSSENFATVRADENEAHFMGGAATALLLEDIGADTASIVAGPELDFVRATASALTAGLKYVDPEAELLVTFTGDFEDASLAREAATAQINQGSEIVYPYLGGAIPAVLTTAAENDVLPVGVSVDKCDDPDVGYGLSILYNPGLFYEDLLEAFADENITEGEMFRLYGVGDDIGVGAIICDPTPEQEEQLEEIADMVASGEIDVAAEMEKYPQ